MFGPDVPGRSDLCTAGATDPTQHRLTLPKLENLAVDTDEAPREDWVAEDEVNGGPFDPRKVIASCRGETQYLWNMEREQDETQLASAESIPTKVTPKPHITARVWFVRTCATKGFEPIFSATLPLETLRVLLCVACQEDVSRVEDLLLIFFADVCRAHFYADAVRDVYVRPPDEDSKAKQVCVCEKLRKKMCRSLDAAQWWREHQG